LLRRTIKKFPKISTRGALSYCRADIGIELQLRDFARAEQGFVKPGRLFGRLSTKAFDVGDEIMDDEIDDAVIGERRAL